MTVAGQFSSVGSEHEPSAAALENKFSSQFFNCQEWLIVKSSYEYLTLRLVIIFSI